MSEKGGWVWLVQAVARPDRLVEIERKPQASVTVAPANKTVRIAWAFMAKGDVYRASAAAD